MKTLNYVLEEVEAYWHTFDEDQKEQVREKLFSLITKKGINEIIITKEECIDMLNSTKLCLMAHPDSGPDSEFDDRIDDLEDIIKFVQQNI